MEAVTIPRSLDDLTPAWLEAVLSAAGCLGEARVTGVENRLVPAATGGGFLSDLVYMSINYDRAEAMAPVSLVLKRPRTAQPGVLGSPWLGYCVEVRFYQEFAQLVPLRVPRCYFAEWDQEDKNFALLLEDLSTLQAGDDLRGCSYEQAAAAVRAIARLHATWWEGQGRERPALPERQRARPGEAQFETVERDFAGLLPDAGLEAGRAVVDRFPALQNELNSAPTTLVHHDFRLDNMFFPPAGTDAAGVEPVVIDWQAMCYARGPLDLGFFLGEGFAMERRRAWEESLLRLYHSELRAAGIKDFDLDACVRNYHLGLLQNHLRWIAVYNNFAEIGGPQKDKASQFLLRSAASVSDFDALALVEQLGTSAP